MDATSFLSEITKEASLQEEAILKKAEETCRGILEEAQKEANRVEEALVHRSDHEIRKQESRLLTQERLESRRSLLNLKAAFAQKAVLGAREEFDALKRGREYQEILKKFLGELVKVLETTQKKVVLRIHPEDELVVKPFLSEFRLSAEVRPDPSLERGLELEDEKGTFRMRNTFDSRLRKAHEEVAQQLNKVLFQSKFGV